MAGDAPGRPPRRLTSGRPDIDATAILRAATIDGAAALGLAAGRGDVSHVLVDGRVVVHERRSTLLNTSDLLARCRARGRDAAAAVAAGQGRLTRCAPPSRSSTSWA